MQRLYLNALITTQRSKIGTQKLVSIVIVIARLNCATYLTLLLLIALELRLNAYKLPSTLCRFKISSFIIKTTAYATLLTLKQSTIS
jgi:hypothetical protein